ncbi:hypothetical protein KJI95_00870 [Shewanella sp. JM162201]|uniref:Guanylate cyclase domain-containing protein n=1 Tax=Shewanella jiangmenensis TaxID=2837387 RepID=A0ABS5UYD2_9GAMM|nr:hypothetical protein [Shewanella jiangmenensis]MBT1443080.1 hypothetical protein [Shewanella jiangmenensis]
MISDVKLEYEEKLVAFVDILGFSSLIGKIEEDEKLHKVLHWALTHINSYKRTSEMENTAHSDLEVSVFSDCIVVTSDMNNFHALVWAVGWLQAQLLGGGILTRGGISIGKVHHSDGILYGSGMLNAYRIENSAAVYPRIVLDPIFSVRLPEKYKSVFLSLDFDGLYYIDPFTFNGSIGDVTALVEDGWDPHEVYLDEVGRHIENGIASAKRVDHRSKWTWLAVRYSVAREAYLQTGETKLAQALKYTEQVNSAER